LNIAPSHGLIGIVSSKGVESNDILPTVSANINLAKMENLTSYRAERLTRMLFECQLILAGRVGSLSSTLQRAGRELYSEGRREA
jgi:hypothetical protein